MNMGIATLLKAAEYIERRDRGEQLHSFFKATQDLNFALFWAFLTIDVLDLFSVFCKIVI